MREIEQMIVDGITEHQMDHGVDRLSAAEQARGLLTPRAGD